MHLCTVLTAFMLDVLELRCHSRAGAGGAAGAARRFERGAPHRRAAAPHGRPESAGDRQRLDQFLRSDLDALECTCLQLAYADLWIGLPENMRVGASPLRPMPWRGVRCRVPHRHNSLRWRLRRQHLSQRAPAPQNALLHSYLACRWVPDLTLLHGISPLPLNSLPAICRLSCAAVSWHVLLS